MFSNSEHPCNRRQNAIVMKRTFMCSKLSIPMKETRFAAFSTSQEFVLGKYKQMKSTPEILESDVMFSLFLLFLRSVSLLSNGRCCSW